MEKCDINRSNNYLHYLIKSLLKPQREPKLNKNSKFFKELNNIINGNCKLNIMAVDNLENPLEKCTKFNDSLKVIRMPLMRNKK